MDFFKNLLGMTGGKRSRRARKHRNRKGGACTSESCAAEFGADSSLSQGESFARMTRAYHGGKRSRKMRGGAADLGQAFEAMPAEMHQQAGTAVLDQAIADLSKFTPAPQTGGAAQLGEAFEALPVAMAPKAGTSVLDTAIAQISKFIPAKGGRRTRRRGGALGSSPVDANPMLLRPEDYPAAFLNPQWVQENVVNPNFHGPDNALVAAPTGGYRRKSRKSRKSRKTQKKAKKCPRGKVYRKTYVRKGRRIMGKCVRK